jgi:plasmid stabilization system protein ParE
MNAIFRPQFWWDIEEGVSYLTREASDITAKRWHTAVQKTAKDIVAQPTLGRIRHDLPWEGMRTLRVQKFGRYLIFYRWDGETVEFLRVKHGMMNLPGLFTLG